MSELSNRIFQTFSDTHRAHEAARTLNKQEWAQYKNLIKAHREQLRFEDRMFEQEYQTRFEVERKRLLKRAGQKERSFKPRFLGTDRFDKDAINRQADWNVREAHHKLKTHLDQKHETAVTELLSRSEYRRKQREKPIRDFNNAADRRTGVERRQRSRAGPSR